MVFNYSCDQITCNCNCMSTWSSSSRRTNSFHSLPSSPSSLSSNYQRSRFSLSYKLHKFLLPKLTHLVIVVLIVVIVFYESTWLRENRIAAFSFFTCHFLTMALFLLAASMDPGFVTRESVKSFIESFSSSFSLGSSDAATKTDPNQSTKRSDDFYYSSEDSDDEIFVQSKKSTGSLTSQKDPAKVPLMTSSPPSTPNSHHGPNHHNHVNPPPLKYKDKEVNFRKCNYCELLQPLRAKHCEECGRCVRKYDHHCPWLGNCVGENNHKFFWTLLFCGFITICLTIHITYHAFHSPPENSKSDISSISEYLKVNIFLIVVFIVEAMFLLVDGVLLSFHTYLMLSNQTSWEFMARSKITYLRDLSDEENPFDSGVLRNCWQFLCNCKMRNWELYFTNFTSSAQQCVTSFVQNGTSNVTSSCYPQLTSNKNSEQKLLNRGPVSKLSTEDQRLQFYHQINQDDSSESSCANEVEDEGEKHNKVIFHKSSTKHKNKTRVRRSSSSDQFSDVIMTSSQTTNIATLDVNSSSTFYTTIDIQNDGCCETTTAGATTTPSGVPTSIGSVGDFKNGSPNVSYDQWSYSKMKDSDDHV